MKNELKGKKHELFCFLACFSVNLKKTLLTIERVCSNLNPEFAKNKVILMRLAYLCCCIKMLGQDKNKKTSTHNFIFIPAIRPKVV